MLSMSLNSFLLSGNLKLRTPERGVLTSVSDLAHSSCNHNGHDTCRTSMRKRAMYRMTCVALLAGDVVNNPVALIAECVTFLCVIQGT